VAARGRFEIGLEADRVEDVVGGETRRERPVARGRGMDPGDRGAHLGREGEVDPAVAQLRLPDRVRGRVEIGHGEEAVGGSSPRISGTASGTMAPATCSQASS
jgi:hypothetical protein